MESWFSGSVPSVKPGISESVPSVELGMHSLGHVPLTKESPLFPEFNWFANEEPNMYVCLNLHRAGEEPWVAKLSVFVHPHLTGSHKEYPHLSPNSLHTSVQIRLHMRSQGSHQGRIHCSLHKYVLRSH